MRILKEPKRIWGWVGGNQKNLIACLFCPCWWHYWCPHCNGSEENVPFLCQESSGIFEDDLLIVISLVMCTILYWQYFTGYGKTSSVLWVRWPGLRSNSEAPPGFEHLHPSRNLHREYHLFSYLLSFLRDVVGPISLALICQVQQG